MHKIKFNFLSTDVARRLIAAPVINSGKVLLRHDARIYESIYELNHQRRADGPPSSGRYRRH